MAMPGSTGAHRKRYLDVGVNPRVSINMNEQPPSLFAAGQRRGAMLLLAILPMLAMLPACHPQAGQQQAALIDLEGISHGTLAHPADGRWTSLFFVATDCPVSNRYAPEIKRICASYAPAGLQCLLVYTDPHFTAGQIRAHAREFGYTLPVIFDAERKLLAQVGATVTPEVALVAPGASLAYRGRIDDLQVEFGLARHSATEHDLRNALDDLVAGRPVRKPRTLAVGCYIE
jgi:hypothetical protein